MLRRYKPLRQHEFFPSGRETFDLSDSPQTVEVSPESSVERNVVAAWDIDPRVQNPAAELADRRAGRAFANPALLCSRIPNGAVATSAGVILTENGRWIPESVGGAVGELPESRNRRRIELEEPQVSVDEEVAVVYSILSEKKIGNYFHWIVEGLTRAAMLERCGVPSSVRLLIPEPVLDLYTQGLAAIGIDDGRVLGWSGASARFRTVYLPSGPQHRGGRPIASALSNLRDLAAPFRSGGAPTRRLWVSRRLAKRRRKRLGGEEHLLAIAEGMGFEEVVAETLTARDQIELFAQADAIAGPHGAGLANAVFMAAGTNVCEAAPELLKPRQKPLFWNLAAAGGQSYGYCVGPAEGLDGKRFERVLAALLT